MADDAEDTDRSHDGDASDGDHVDGGDREDAPDGDPTGADSDDSGVDSADETAEEMAVTSDTDADPGSESESESESESGAADSESESESDSSVDPPTDTPDIHPRAEEIADAADPGSGDDGGSDASEATAEDDGSAASSNADDVDEAPTVADLAADESESHSDPDADADADSEDSDPDTDSTNSDPDSDSEDADADSPGDADSDFDSDAESEIGPSSAEIVAGTDGGAAVNAGETGVAEPAPPVEGFEPEGPESDREMPLADHIEEMVRRLAVVLIIGGAVTLLLYPGADLVNSAFGVDLVSSTQVIDFLWNKHIPGAPEMVDRRPRVYGPLELVLTELKVAALGGLVVALPAFVYETYLFMRPGLYPKERRYYLAAVPTSVVLAFIGIAFAHFLVLPAIFAYFTSYTTGTALVAFGLKETFNLILILMGYNAIIFQIPLFVMLAIMMNLVTRTWMEERRLLFWGTFLGLAFLVSPDPTGMAPIIIALTMIGLFEGTLLALRWTRRGN